MTDALVLGPDPGDLTVRVTMRDPSWGESMVLKENDTPIPWPAAPVLEFDSDPALNITGVLSADEETDTTDALATWSMTQEQFAVLTTGTDVALTVAGETYWKGQVTCLS